MSSPDSWDRTTPSASSPSTERSALLKHPGLDAVYGTDTTTSGSEYGSSESSSLLSQGEDEEASIESPVTSSGAEGYETHSPLSTKAILWIVLPMLLGQSRPDACALKIPALTFSIQLSLSPTQTGQLLWQRTL